MSPQWVNRQDTKKQGPSNQTLPRTSVEGISVDKCRPPVLAAAANQAVPSPITVSAQHLPWVLRLRAFRKGCQHWAVPWHSPWPHLTCPKAPQLPAEPRGYTHTAPHSWGMPKRTLCFPFLTTAPTEQLMGWVPEGCNPQPSADSRDGLTLYLFL